MEAEELGYSHEIIENLRNQTEDWNQDNITNEVLDEIENLNVYIKTSSTQKKSIVFIGSITNIAGGVKMMINITTPKYLPYFQILLRTRKYYKLRGISNIVEGDEKNIIYFEKAMYKYR